MTLPDDMGDAAYAWEEDRLVSVDWSAYGVTGEISFDGLTMLRRLNVCNGTLTKIDIDENTELTFLGIYGNQLTEVLVL